MTQIFKLSVSKTSTFKDCKAKYKFSYIQKLPKKTWEHHIFGRFCHKVLEDFHLTYINGSQEKFNEVMTRCFKEAFHSQEFNGKVSSEAKKEAFQILKEYLQILSKYPEEVSKVLAVERNFDIKINDNLILTGMIDRIQLDTDGIIHICDYKTTKNKAYLKDDLQLLTYAYALLQEDPTIEKIRGSYILLRHNFEYFDTKEFSKEKILSIKSRYENYADTIHAETEFEANPTKLCQYCDYVSGPCVEGKNFVSKTFKTGATKY